MRSKSPAAKSTCASTVSTRWSSTVSTRLDAAAHMHALLAPARLSHARVMRARTATLSAVRPQQLRHRPAHAAPARACGTGPPRLVTPPTDRQRMRSAAQPIQRIRHGSTRCAGPQGQVRPGGSRGGGAPAPTCAAALRSYTSLQSYAMHAHAHATRARHRARQRDPLDSTGSESPGGPLP
jgi:hypothetical protein